MRAQTARNYARVFIATASIAILTLATGCRRTSTTSISAGGPAIIADPVGPVPGAPTNIVRRSNPYSNDPVALQDGRRFFNWYNCSGCHGGHAGGGMGPSLRDPDWLYGDHDDQIYDSIAHGRSNGMPAWGTKIPSVQIWELVAYIKSMGTPQEPDPPVEPPNEQVPNPSNNTPLGTGMQTRIAGRR